jgi:hypothetical protein
VSRGTVNGEKVVSMAATDEFRDGYSRTFGDKAPQRGRWVYDVQLQRLVPADQYVPPSRALDAPILSGRFYEGARATDGADIGSRRKHRAYMKEHGLAPADDFSPRYYEGIKREREAATKKERREVLARKMYEIDKP